ncbi:MAG: S-methyl-5-thioribose-1-phosphate isomerase [Actinobacteria bacterium]|nr:S-methyl-5-thioribose-1-phosphate isomerase [Actinomycetota bacterium]MBL7123324.1 S-methyl-5-thioribose-1-phosphate isomerase [Actinomycetota bacterium]
MGDGNVKQKLKSSGVSTLVWDDKSLRLIDQRELPFKEIYINCSSTEQVASAIRDMVVRGAPAIGVTAAYGTAIAAAEFRGSDKDEFLSHMENSIKILSRARPTAVNLFWALNCMKKILYESKHLTVDEIKQKLLDKAKKIEEEDLSINYRIGKNGKDIFNKNKNKLKVLTHCNAGALATSGYGTALAVIRSLHSASKIENVIVDETRPYLQGARLTAWELYQEEIPFFIITDNMAGYFMSKKMVDVVIVGADRVASNGDSANKIGTLGVSILAKYYDIPFYIAAPKSTIDTGICNGGDIPIEERKPSEVREVMGTRIIPDYMPVRNPSFDVTPSENITAIITEEDVVYPPFKKNLAQLMKK